MQDLLNAATEWITSAGGITVLASVALGIISRVIMKIFREAVKFKSTLMSKSEWITERQLIMQSMNDMELKIRNSVRQDIEIEQRAHYKDLDDIREAVKKNQNVDKLIDEKIKTLNDKFQKQTQLEAKITYLERRMNAYDNKNYDGDPLRRSSD